MRDWPVSAVAKYIAIGTGGLVFDSRVGQIEYSVVTAATFLHNCVVLALNRGDGTRYSLHASA